MIDWEKARIDLIGQALQGMLERDSTWSSKIVSDIFYKRLAKHCVKIADAIISELKKSTIEDDDKESHS